MIGAATGYIEDEVHAGDIINNTLILDLYFKKDSRNFREAWVKCKCQFCGNEFDVRYKALKNGSTQSCGCAKKSIGAKKEKNQIIQETAYPISINVNGNDNLIDLNITKPSNGNDTK